MKIIILLIYFTLYSFSGKSQVYFDHLPISDGQSNQSRLFDSFVDSNLIYALGDLLDTTIDPLNPEVRPWLAVFDYSGNVINKWVLDNKDIKGSMGLFGSRILKNSRENLLYNTVLNTNNTSKSIIIEINPDNGEILHHKVFLNPLDSTKYLLPGWVTYKDSKKDILILENEFEIGNYSQSYIITIDSNFNILNDFIVEDNGRNNYAYYLKVDSDSNFILVGESWKRNDMNHIPEVKPFFMKVDSDGEILNFVLGQGINNNTVLFSPVDAYNVIQDSENNWILTTNMIVSTGSCSGCFYDIPYMFSYSSDFTNLNWALNFSEDPNDKVQNHSIFSTAYDTINGHILVTGSNLKLEQNNSYIIKANINGDSIWTRHYIPLNWDQDTVAWALLKDIKVTKYGSYIAVGHVSERVLFLWRSWIIHIDSDGCIIPGCQKTVSNFNLEGIEFASFKIFPNPCSSYVGILCNSDFHGDYKILVNDINGRTIATSHFYSELGYQFLLNISDWTNGLYILNIIDSNGNLIQSEQLIKN